MTPEFRNSGEAPTDGHFATHRPQASFADASTGPQDEQAGVARGLPPLLASGRHVQRKEIPMKLSELMIRYIVNDVDTAIGFYTKHLKFNVSDQSGSHFALLARGNLQLVLSPPKGPGGGSQHRDDVC
jgi:hypothetical protein